MIARTVDDLRSNALIFWPNHLVVKEGEASIIPKLIETQEKFIGVLYVSDSTPTAWKHVLSYTEGMPLNLFLKHLMVLSDIGGEKLKRFRSSFSRIFIQDQMEYVWKDKKYNYKFQSIDSEKWDNKSLYVDGKGLLASVYNNKTIEDIIMMLLFCGSSVNPGIPDEFVSKCMIGTLLGNKNELDVYVRQRYIWVSKITGGAASNAMGYLAEEYVKELLTSLLPDWSFSKKTIPGISHNEGRTDISFDLVAESPSGKYCAIELSFQVTTNSVIERKAGQAQARQELMHQNNCKIAYIIDGAGNFERKSALSTICQFSDFTITYREDEIKKLSDFLRRWEDGT